VSAVLAWGLFVLVGLGGLAAIAWTTVIANQFGSDRLHLGNTGAAFWTMAAFVVLFVGGWLPMSLVLGARNLVGRAPGTREAAAISIFGS
jgi:hypothetical protein